MSIACLDCCFEIGQELLFVNFESLSRKKFKWLKNDTDFYFQKKTKPKVLGATLTYNLT